MHKSQYPNRYLVSVWIEINVMFSSFFFFSLRVNSNLTWVTVHALFITVHILKNIKNGSHVTIHTFKNYFATELSVFSFNNNKLNPNGSLIFVEVMGSRGGNFSPLRLTHPSLFHSAPVFPAPQRWWGEDRARFQPRTMGQGGMGLNFLDTLRLAPLCVTKGYNCKFFIP